jgi:hypothetical protein
MPPAVPFHTHVRTLCQIVMNLFAFILLNGERAFFPQKVPESKAEKSKKSKKKINNDGSNKVNQG